MQHSPLYTVLVPVFNEEETVVEVMHKLQKACSDAQVVYVDDGSVDRSLALLEENAKEGDQVLHKPNGGKGSAIREGLQYAKGKYTVIQDADLEYDPAEITLLVEEAEQGGHQAVFGSRFLKKNPNIYKRFLLGNKVLTLIVNILFGSKLTDSYTCYKLLETNLFTSLELEAQGFEMEAEICGKCLKKGIEIQEIPISYTPRTIAEGKKIGWRDALRGLKMMWKVRWS